MAIYSLSEILFRTHEITHVRTRLCPQCLTENNVDLKICASCSLEIPEYTDSTFIFERAKHISEEEFTDIGIGIGANFDKLKAVKEKFLEQYEVWDQVVLTAKFISQYTISRVNPIESAREFLRHFPLSTAELEELHFRKFDFQLPTRNSSEIRKKLIEIERRGFKNFFRDYADWSQNFLDESENPNILSYLNWMNIAYGRYLDFREKVIPINEKSAEDLNRAISHIPVISDKAFTTEVTLFPLHWKYLVEEKLKPNAKPLISKPRYQVVLEQWIPRTNAHIAWKELGLYYCKNENGPLPKSVIEYRDKQSGLAFENKDYNFVFSLLVITGEKIDSNFDFPYRADSYFAPLISIMKEESFVRDYFLKPVHKESWLRAFHFFDFTQSSFASELAQKITSELSDDEYPLMFESFHPSLHSALMNSVFSSGSKKKLTTILSKSDGLKELLPQVRLSELYKQNPELLFTLLEKAGFSYHWKPDEILALLKQCPNDLEFAKTGLRIVQQADYRSVEVALTLFDLWVQLKTSGDDEAAQQYFDKLGYFIRNYHPFSMDPNETIPEVQSKLMSFLLSPEKKQQAWAETFIQAYVDPRGSKVESLLTLHSSEEIFKAFLETLKNSKHPIPQKIAFNFIFSLMQQGQLSQGNLKVLWDDLPLLDSEYRSQFEYRLKEKLQITSSPQQVNVPKPKEDASLKEIEELKKKLAEMEQEKKLIAENARREIEARDKTAQYQIKLAELKSWFQIEMTKVTTSGYSPTEQGQKISELSDKYATALNELSKLLT